MFMDVRVPGDSKTQFRMSNGDSPSYFFFFFEAGVGVLREVGGVGKVNRAH